MGVTDIGCRSVKLITNETFGIGVTHALFHAEGGLPVLNVLFAKLAIAHVNSTEQCLKIEYGILSDLAAVFLTEVNRFIYLVFKDRVINKSIFVDRFNDSNHFFSIVIRAMVLK